MNTDSTGARKQPGPMSLYGFSVTAPSYGGVLFSGAFTMRAMSSTPLKAPRLPLYLDLIRWNRPAGWLLLLWPTLGALWLAAGGFPGVHVLAVFTLGTILMRSAGCCINDVADRNFDRHVQRTAHRPITSGQISVQEALGIGAVLALLAFALVLTLGGRVVFWSIPALLIAIAYPFAKRFLSTPQAVLGVAFSWGIPMAFVAMQGYIPAYSLLLVAGNLCWVMAYDTEYAMVDRDDDLKIGVRSSAIAFGRWDVTVIGLCYAFYTAAWWGILWRLFLQNGAAASWAHIIWGTSLVAVLAQIVWHLWLIRHRERQACFTAFRLNHWIGFTAFAAIVMLTQWAAP